MSVNYMIVRRVASGGGKSLREIIDKCPWSSRGQARLYREWGMSGRRRRKGGFGGVIYCEVGE